MRRYHEEPNLRASAIYDDESNNLNFNAILDFWLSFEFFSDAINL